MQPVLTLVLFYLIAMCVRSTLSPKDNDLFHELIGLKALDSMLTPILLLGFAHGFYYGTKWKKPAIMASE